MVLAAALPAHPVLDVDSRVWALELFVLLAAVGALAGSSGGRLITKSSVGAGPSSKSLDDRDEAFPAVEVDVLEFALLGRGRVLTRTRGRRVPEYMDRQALLIEKRAGRLRADHVAESRVWAGVRRSP